MPVRFSLNSFLIDTNVIQSYIPICSTFHSFWWLNIWAKISKLKVIIFYITELIAIRPPLLILHFKNFLNMKIQSLATLHVKPKHRRVSRRKSNGSWSFFGPAFQIEKKEGERRRKRMKERPKEAAAGEHTQPYGKLFSLFWKTVLPKGRYRIVVNLWEKRFKLHN